MIEVGMIAKCKRCEDMSKINNVYIDTQYTDAKFVYGELVKEYICDCGYITKYEETIRYTLTNRK